MRIHADPDPKLCNEQGLFSLSPPPPGTQTLDRTIGPSRVLYYPHAQTCWGRLPTLPTMACQHPWSYADANPLSWI